MDLMPKNWVDQVVGMCVSVFLGAMALYGAVLLIQAIWIWLVGGVAIVVGIMAIAWMLRMRMGRW